MPSNVSRFRFRRRGSERFVRRRRPHHDEAGDAGDGAPRNARGGRDIVDRRSFPCQVLDMPGTDRNIAWKLAGSHVSAPTPRLPTTSLTIWKTC